MSLPTQIVKHAKERTECVRLQQISRHVHRMHGLRDGRYPSGNPVVVSGPDSRLLIDSAVGVETPNVDAFLLSHYHEDHVVGVARSGLPAMIHERDHPALSSWNGFKTFCGYDSQAWRADMRDLFTWEPVPTATAFRDGHSVDLGGTVRVRAIWLPGHTPGHCGFWIEPDNVLYLGDIDLSTFGPFYGDAASSLQASSRSLQQVRDIDAAMYVTFHHKGFVNGPVAFRTLLDRFESSVTRRSQRILDLLKEHPCRPDELVGRGVVFRPGSHPSYGHEAEQRMCQLHLEQLVADNKACGPASDGRYALL